MLFIPLFLFLRFTSDFNISFKKGKQLSGVTGINTQ